MMEEQEELKVAGFTLSSDADSLPFTSLLLPLNLRQAVGAEGAEGRWEEGSGLWWRSLTGWGHDLGWTGPGNFRCVFQLFPGWEGFRVWVEVEGWCRFGVLGIWQSASHSRKLDSFTQRV